MHSRPLARGIAALASFGHDPRRRERLLAARDEGCCHQCHAPLQNVLNDCPCPHWFITSGITVERIAPVLRMYPVSDVLHFILLHLAADNAGRPAGRNRVSVAARQDGSRLTIRIGRKLWSFRTTRAEGGPALLTVGLYNPRTGRHSSVELPATADDIEVMDALTHAMDEKPTGPLIQQPRVDLLSDPASIPSTR